MVEHYEMKGDHREVMPVECVIQAFGVFGGSGRCTTQVSLL
jgi:hypothetical protein